MGALGLLIPSRWRRLHRKLCVVDGELAFCGGINILDDLYDPNHGALTAPRLAAAIAAAACLSASPASARDIEAGRAALGSGQPEKARALLAQSLVNDYDAIVIGAGAGGGVVAADGVKVSAACRNFDPYPQVLRNLRCRDGAVLTAAPVQASMAKPMFGFTLDPLMPKE